MDNMLIRYSSSPEELEVEGGKGDFDRLVKCLRAGMGELLAEAVDDASPYERALRSVQVRQSPRGDVVIELMDSDNVAVIGPLEKLRILANNLEKLAHGGGDHWHAEYFPGHFFLGEASIPAVFSVVKE